MLWYDRRLIEGGTRLDFDSIRQTTLRPFGLLFMGPATRRPDRRGAASGFSLRGCEQARENLRRECGDRRRRSFDAVRAADRGPLGATTSTGSRSRAARRPGARCMATALYHSLIKPCFGDDESPFWPTSGPFAFDVCTMWDIYKTQFPLLMAIAPDRAADLLESLIRVCEEEGNFPIGYRMARGADRFFRQASALAHTALADAHALALGGLDWTWALVHMVDDLRRMYGEDFFEHGVVHPITHTLDLAYAPPLHRPGRPRRWATSASPTTWTRAAGCWVNAFDPATGLLRDSEFYEGGKWNYSFRLLHDMRRADRPRRRRRRVRRRCSTRSSASAPAPVTQPGRRPRPAEMAAGYALNRFEGLNNEPDMEAPWAYHYAGRPDRTAEVVHAALTWQFGTGAGGLPGNDDSGGLSSWYVWASLGLFPIAGQSLFLVNAPAFARAALRVDGGEFVVETTGHRETPDRRRRDRARHRPVQYVQAATSQRPSAGRHPHRAADVHRGGVLHLELGPGAVGLGALEPARRPCPTLAPRRRTHDERTRNRRTAGHRRPGRPGDLRPLRRGPQPRRGRADQRLRRRPAADVADRRAAGRRAAAQAARPAAALQPGHHRRAPRARRRLPGARTGATWPGSPAGWSSCSPSRCRRPACRCTWCRTPTSSSTP